MFVATQLVQIQFDPSSQLLHPLVRRFVPPLIYAHTWAAMVLSSGVTGTGDRPVGIDSSNLCRSKELEPDIRPQAGSHSPFHTGQPAQAA